MKLYAKGLHGKLWDLDENKEVMRPIWFDEATGAFECYQTNPFGRIVRDGNGDKLTWLMQGRIKWIPDRAPEVHRKITAIGQKCMSCTRDAEWSVGDETPVEPVAGVLEGVGNVLFSRGRLTGKRFYCAFHYKAPRVVDAKGEVMSTWDDAGGVRPQWHS